MGEGLRREVFFFRSEGVELYGSLYAASEISRPYGVVCCNSWGVEADRCDPLQRSVALAMARLGGAGLVFHYPGYGDSYGDPAGLDLPGMAAAAVDAVAEASDRCRDLDWTLAGFMLGASVACLAQSEAGVDRLLLVQPALRPGSYLRRLTETRRPLAPGPGRPKSMFEVGSVPGMAYGYPIPLKVVEEGEEADAAVLAALDAFDGDGVVVRQAGRDDLELVPRRFERIDVSGTWRFASLNAMRLSKGAVAWLDRSSHDRVTAAVSS